MQDNNELLSLIALTQIKLIGPVSIRNLISYCGSASAVFKAGKHKLQMVPGIDEIKSQLILSTKDHSAAQKELQFIQRNGIECIPFYDSAYPQRLTNINDAPALLYYKGKNVLNNTRSIAIVGTRKATAYGKLMVEKLIEGIASYEPLIISGLAYGIDIMAHKSALQHNLSTVAVLGYGLNTIYPNMHQSTADKMLHQGGLVTEYRSDQGMQPEFFADRNKIIAALSDAIIVVESAEKGGALITAKYAADYNRDVFAFPGRSGDQYSEGCNNLIKNNKAALIDNANDLIKAMRWDIETESKTRQRLLLFDLSDQEQMIFDFLKTNSDSHIDTITTQTNLPHSKVAGVLLDLEIKGAIIALPGKRFKAVT
jgi:DNA processing protein